MKFWLKLGFISFGGPTGQIAIMHTELVDRKRWVDESRFLHALNYCMLLPGPEAQQLATYIGWLLHGIPGGLAAGILFVLPSVFILWGLSWLYAACGNIGWVHAVFYGLKPAVAAIVAFAVIRIGRRVLKNNVMWFFAVWAFLQLQLFGLPFPAIIFGAGILGMIGGRKAPKLFNVIKGHGGKNDGAASLVLSGSHIVKGGKGRFAKVLLIHLVLWWLPLLVAGLSMGWTHTIVGEGVFFSKAALVTFGGAYAVLPYVAAQTVQQYGWLSAEQMMSGLALAESTPGPLIMVLQFVGFMGGWNHPGDLPPLLSATLCALMTTWVTFVPCFLFIFLGAPYVEKMRGSPVLNSALSAVTASVVGVILSLALWFSAHVLLPETGVIDYYAGVLALFWFGGMLWRNWGILVVVFGGALSGLPILLLR